VDTFVVEGDVNAEEVITAGYEREAVATFAGTIAFVGRESPIPRVVGERL
jgi:hypothetical protein